MFTRILVALDQTERAADALAGARALSERFGSHLVLVEVAPWPAYLLDLAEARARLDSYASQLRAAGFSATTVVRGDIAEDGIAAVAREESADLIVLAPHRHVERERLSHLLRPSVSAQMISHAPIPFLIVPEPPHAARAVQLLAGSGSAGPVVLGLDGDECAERAIPLAVTLARACDQRLLLVRVLAGDDLPSLACASMSTRHVATQALLKAEQTAHEYVAAVRRRIVAGHRVKVQTRVVSGDVAEKLLEVAEGEGACALVIGTHGRGALARMLLGSVAADLVRRTTLPLMVVPTMQTTATSTSTSNRVDLHHDTETK
jgi:nucleotide-binding universal stress UspA family protein